MYNNFWSDSGEFKGLQLRHQSGIAGPGLDLDPVKYKKCGDGDTPMGPTGVVTISANGEVRVFYGSASPSRFNMEALHSITVSDVSQQFLQLLPDDAMSDSMPACRLLWNPARNQPINVDEQPTMTNYRPDGASASTSAPTGGAARIGTTA